MLHDIFDLKRFGLYLKKELILNGKQTLITAGSLCSIMLVFFTISTLQKSNIEVVYLTHKIFFSAFLLIGGFIYTSTVFKNLNSEGDRYLFLTLPASSFEKLLSAFLLTNMGFIIVFTLAFFIYVGMAHEIHNIIHGIDFSYVSLKQINYWQAIESYAVVQSVFLLGAVAFRKRNFITTVIAILAVGIVCSILILFLGGIVVYPVTGVEEFSLSAITKGLSQGLMVDVSWLKKMSSWSTRLCFAPFFLVVTYFKIKEREI